MRTRLTAAMTLAVFAGACTGQPKQLPPRTAPPRQHPPVALPPAPPPEGLSRVVLHTTDGPMKITGKADTEFVPPGSNVPATRSGDLCTTPCVVDLPAGNYRLYLASADGTYSRGDVDDIVVHPDATNYYVRAPGRYEPAQWLHVIPSVLIIAGSILVVGGLALTRSENDSDQTTGLALMGGGFALTITGGILAYDESRGSVQEGKSTTWAIPAR
jgi:hypothetical protein